MKKNRLKWLWVFLFLAFLGIFFSCAKDEPVKIGFMAGLSGRVADLGVSGRNGVMLAVEQKNASGGINGKPLELIVRDDQQDSEYAQAGIKDLLNQNIELIIGPMTSSMAMRVVSLVNESNSFLLSPTVTTTDLFNIDDHFLRVISTTRDYADKSAKYQYHNLGARKAVAIYDIANRSYTESWLNNFKETFENIGGEFLKVVSFRSSQNTSFYEMVESMLDQEPDIFLIISNAVDAALICQQVRKIDQQVTIVMSEWASTERYIQLSGTASEGVYVGQFLDRNDTSPRYLEFAKAYEERFGQEPGFAGIAGYDAGIVAMEAMENRKKTESIKEAIVRIKTFQCVQQKISIDQFGDAERKTYITKVEGGRYITIE